MWNDIEMKYPKCSQSTDDHIMEANWAVETVAMTNSLTFHCLELHYFHELLLQLVLAHCMPILPHI
jgi:hypothetical protein